MLRSIPRDGDCKTNAPLLAEFIVILSKVDMMHANSGDMVACILGSHIALCVMKLFFLNTKKKIICITAGSALGEEWRTGATTTYNTIQYNNGLFD